MYLQTAVAAWSDRDDVGHLTELVAHVVIADVDSHSRRRVTTIDATRPPVPDRRLDASGQWSDAAGHAVSVDVRLTLMLVVTTVDATRDAACFSVTEHDSLLSLIHI